MADADGGSRDRVVSSSSLGVDVVFLNFRPARAAGT